MNSLSPFHVAFPVNNIAKTEKFFVDIIGCSIGRQSENWIDFNFFGHQISAHLNPEKNTTTPTNIVDNDNIPIRHFGLAVPWKEWHELVEKFKAKKFNSRSNRISVSRKTLVSRQLFLFLIQAGTLLSLSHLRMKKFFLSIKNKKRKGTL